MNAMKLISLVLFLISFSATGSDLSDLMKEVTLEYQSEIKGDFGVKLEILPDAENPLYFGGASLESGVFSISAGRDLMQNKGMTEGAVLFLLCHEVGHLVGGIPKKETNTWASTEGQSDYYAASTCLKRLYLKRFSHSHPYVTNEIRVLCHGDEICGKTMAAGKEFMDALYAYIDVPEMPRPELKKTERPLLKWEKLNYPTLQCRLDTIKNGARGLPRPSCWFPEQV